MKYRFLIACSVFSLFTHAQMAKKPDAKTLVSQMTLEEKIHFVAGMGMKLPGSGDNAAIGQSEDKLPGAAGTTYPIPRLGIPSVVLADGPAGLRITPIRRGDSSRTYYCTAFPVGTLLASTWDTALVQQLGVAFGNEVKEYGADILLAPALNIQRNPLGGRNFEYYSEDPLVAGNITAAIVNGIQSNGVGTSIKHFAANNQETNRMMVNTIASERALREIYLKGFEIAVQKSHPWTVMSSYNKINGAYASENYDLLTTILRKEWGFKGLVMSDWFGGKDAVAQMKAGNDLLMPGTPAQLTQITNAVKDGSLSEKVLDGNAERILQIVLRCPAYAHYHFSDKPDLKAHAQASRTAATEGMVLLKNDNAALPFHKNIKKIAVFGNTSYEFISGGTGSGDVYEAHTVTLAEGLTAAGYTVDADLQNAYQPYVVAERAKLPKPKNFFDLPPMLPEMPMDKNRVMQRADAADAAIITIGRNSGEFNDRKLENDFNLSDEEHMLIKNITKVFHAKGKKVIVLLNVGGVLEMMSWRNDPDAILLAWQPGQEAGHAVADILSGRVNPSGKLAVSFPVRYNDVPSAKNFPGKNLSDQPEKGIGGFQIGFPSEVTYEEGIYVGYRYYNTFHVKPAYEFGYGLSYTNFKYGNLKLSSTTFNGAIIATVDITNTGGIAGKEVVQLYISAPATSTMKKPAEELKGFAKTRLLQPGQTQTISFPIKAADLASYNTAASAWIADAGTYIVKVGASSSDIKGSASFMLAKPVITQKVHDVLKPQMEIAEMKQ